MSSTFHILCLSHDPAITITGAGYNRPEEAEAAISDDDTAHPECDLLIARYSGGLIELGCPPTGDQPRAHQHWCWQHRSTEWVDVAWLRILAVARIAQVLPSEFTSSYHFKCWPAVRLQRLRHELGLEALEVQP
ncbi:hypothetical protein ABZ636_03785 [Streptomyces sp. NPDC007251]|uniref:hypothetical protein n=1 Tax=Streptomyces sp. NPDC007251 TaxID=3154483 RepID=UPI0033C9B9E9